MFFIHRGLIVLVASDAFKNFVVVRIDVTGGAVLPLVAVRAGIDREEVCVMVEGRRRPGIHRVAGSAILRKIQSDVVGVGWPLEIILMA